MNLFVQDKEAAMREFKAHAEEIARRMPDRERPVVWGQGPIDSPLVIVGEAPGEFEERYGRPFAGPAGRLLDRALAHIGLARERIYITNVVKRRPIERTPTGGIRNRRPSAEEVKIWLPILMQEIEIISPSTILCLGTVAAMWLIKKDFSFAADREKWHEGPFGSRVTATFHPAYVLRMGDDSNQSIQAAFYKDLARVRQRLEELGELAVIEAR